MSIEEDFVRDYAQFLEVFRQTVEAMKKERGAMWRRLKPRMRVIVESAAISGACFMASIVLAMGALTFGHDAWRIGAVAAVAAGLSCIVFNLHLGLYVLYQMARIEIRVLLNVLRFKRALFRFQNHPAYKNAVKGKQP